MTFRSVHHPGAVSRPWLALQAQARPVALALLFVMTVGLAAALRGQDILWPFVGGTAAAYAVAAATAQNRLVTTPAEVEVRGPFATVRSMWDVAGTDTGGPLQGRAAPVFSARLQNGELTVGLGDTVVSFLPADWPEFDELVDAMRGAAREGQVLLSPPVA